MRLDSSDLSPRLYDTTGQGMVLNGLTHPFCGSGRDVHSLEERLCRFQFPTIVHRHLTLYGLWLLLLMLLLLMLLLLLVLLSRGSSYTGRVTGWRGGWGLRGGGFWRLLKSMRKVQK